MIRAVVFDFDGVIANTEPLHFQALRDVLAQQAVALTEAEYYDRYLGYDDVGAFGAIAANRGVQWDPGHVAGLVARKAARLEALEGAASVLFPGAAAAIRRMAEECPLGIASGALRAEILHILNREDLAGFFPVVVAAEDTPTSKPAPDPYLRAVEQMAAATGLALAPSDCVAIEDSRWGLESARSAGLRTVGITHTYPADTLTCAADTVISHLDQLTWALLGKFENVRR
jgi:HAD superfamily hydrolase (TIGR01509 family)